MGTPVPGGPCGSPRGDGRMSRSQFSRGKLRSARPGARDSSMRHASEQSSGGDGRSVGIASRIAAPRRPRRARPWNAHISARKLSRHSTAFGRLGCRGLTVQRAGCSPGSARVDRRSAHRAGGAGRKPDRLAGPRRNVQRSGLDSGRYKSCVSLPAHIGRVRRGVAGQAAASPPLSARVERELNTRWTALACSGSCRELGSSQPTF